MCSKNFVNKIFFLSTFFKALCASVALLLHNLFLNVVNKDMIYGFGLSLSFPLNDVICFWISICHISEKLEWISNLLPHWFLISLENNYEVLGKFLFCNSFILHYTQTEDDAIFGFDKIQKFKFQMHASFIACWRLEATRGVDVLIRDP